MTFISYAQNYEDVMLYRALRHVEAGVYIDVGAAHPQELSVTKAFYDRGWHGINIEPDPDYAAQLRQARPRDVTLEIALGGAAGRMVLNRIAGTGLSTFDATIAARHGEAGYRPVPLDVTVMTLADVCRAHARADVHILKIDAEGAERDVLQGADFAACRPWIVVVEATEPLTMTPNHQDWEPILLAAGYGFVWFDGLNRFYVAREHEDELRPAFVAPPNCFDDFVRADEAGWPVHAAAAKAATAAVQADSRAAQAEARAAQAEAAAARAEAAATQAAGRAVRAEAGRAAAAAAHAAALADLAALHASTSWRLTGPLRALRGLARGRIGVALIDAGLSQARTERLRRVAGEDGNATKRAARVAFYALSRGATRVPGAAGTAAAVARLLPGPSGWLRRRAEAYHLAATGRRPAAPAAPAPAAPASGAVLSAPAARSRTVHQFHSGSATGDAVTNAMLLTRRWLRGLGYASEIFVEHRDPRLADELYEIGDLPRHGDYVLIVHHSMGYDAGDRIAALPARKILMYHNITPPEFLEDFPEYIPYAELGRRQLDQLRPHMFAALADSEVNALELRAHGYDAPVVCPFLFDVEALLARAGEAAARPDGAPFTVLFVGRVVASKGQAELVDAFAEFRRRWDRPCRLVLVGRMAAADAPYPAEIRRRIALHGLEGAAFLTGPVTDEELHGWYRAADLYVSLSHHEGFGVPLVEAMAYGVPIVAWPAAAVPYTLDGAGELLTDRSPASVAAAMLRRAGDAAPRAAGRQRQRQALDRFRIDRLAPRMLAALLAAGAALPPDDGVRRALAANLRFAVTGHVNGSYSLASMNRAMALALEAARPHSVRLLPVETVPTTDLSRVPAGQAPAIAGLAARPAPPSGPEVVISQHYPVHVPTAGADAAIAMVAWEELLLPPATVAVLNAGFAAVFTHSRFVAKVLIDSGVSRPVRSIGNPLGLEAFHRLGAERAAGRRDRGRTVGFLHVSSCFPRKGVDVLLAAYVRAFRAGEPVRLVIKGFPNPHNDVAEQIDRLLKADPGAPEIVLVNRDLAEAELLDLYREADVAVLPTRGEGFNLPAAEAMAAGLPLIVTGFGGHLDFCTEAEARFLDFRFAASASHLAQPGSVWVEPDQAGLVAALRQAFDDIAGDGGDGGDARGDAGGGAGSAVRAARARAAVRERLDPAAWADRVTGHALDALTAPAAPPLRIAWMSTWDVRCGIAEYSRFLVDRLAGPDAADLGALAVLCDDRTTPRPPAGRVRVLPSWRLADETSIDGLARAVAAEDPHALVIQHQPGLVRWPDLARLLADRRVRGRVTVVTLHATARLFEIADAQQRAEVIDALGRASRVLVHRVADLTLLKGLGLTGNVTLFPHGAPPRHPAPPARALAPADAPVVGCHGFFLPGKGIPRLIEAVAQLRQHWPRLRLRLVNAEHTDFSREEIAQCRRLAARLGLDAAIEWDTAFHPQAEIMHRLGGCDLLVLPYDESPESSSAALRNALASGVPVAVTPAGIFDEAGEAVHRFDRIDVAATVAGIDRLLRDQAMRRRYQEAGAAWLAAHGWDLLARRLHGMLAGLRASMPDAGARRTDTPVPGR